jgi:hypothetical protein
MKRRRWPWVVGAIVIALATLAKVGTDIVRGETTHFNEASATAALRTIGDAESIYAKTSHRSFSETLTGLCASGGVDANMQPVALTDPVLCGHGPGGTATTFRKNGYNFRYMASGKPREITHYSISADPFSRGWSGQRSFYVDESRVIRANATAPATSNDPPI